VSALVSALGVLVGVFITISLGIFPRSVFPCFSSHLGLKLVSRRPVDDGFLYRTQGISIGAYVIPFMLREKLRSFLSGALQLVLSGGLWGAYVWL